MEKEDLETAMILIAKDFGQDDAFLASFGKAVETMDALRENLRAAIGWLLDNDFNKLLNALYRIDVPEEVLRQSLEQSPNVAESLAEIVLLRQIKKIETRKKYR